MLVYQLVSRRRYDRRKKALEENEKKVSITRGKKHPRGLVAIGNRKV